VGGPGGGLLSLESARIVILLGGLLYASYWDLRRREVSDGVWIVLTLAGTGFLLLSEPETTTMWLLVALLGLFTLQHFVPWDSWLGGPGEGSLLIEVGLYALMFGSATWAFFFLAPGPNDQFYAALGAVIMARLLFEAHLLYGGADAKALMAIGLVLPLAPAPWVPLTGPSSPLLENIPFAFTVLVDASLATLVVPLAIAVGNLYRGDRELRGLFHTYSLPTEELPRRFVWLKDPEPSEAEDAETTEEDEARRRAQAQELLQRGIRRVRVTPQLPFLVALLAGTLLSLAVGNLLFALVAFF
jgi:Flp pilus assembly protein protease CpaA